MVVVVLLGGASKGLVSVALELARAGEHPKTSAEENQSVCLLVQ